MRRLVCGCIGVLAMSTLPAWAGEFSSYHEEVLGTSLELRVEADTEAAARRAEGRVLGEIERLRAIFSGYDPASEFSHWRQGRAVPVSAELFEVLGASDLWRDRTGGAFDPRVEALSRAWAEAERRGRRPSAGELAAAREAMAGAAWRLDPARRAAERLVAFPLTFNAIAKGFIVERACRAGLAAEGVRGVMLHVGGDLYAAGEPARVVGIAPARGDSEASEPLAFVEVRNQAVATSGDAQRGFRIGGRRYSHILDPRTGEPASGVVQATVIAPRGVDADALATALNVLPPDEGLRLVEGIEGGAGLLVLADGQVRRSRHWGDFERPRPGPAEGGGDDAAAPAAEPWGRDFELAINFEINRPPSGATTKGYRRPYVVIWAEDESGKTVRTLVLWVSLGGSGPDRWLPDLSRWYRDDPGKSQVEKKNMVFTVARPTRPPGKYNLIWDGKDDRGNLLGPGKYTLYIEAAREEGTHQLLRKELDLNDRPFAEELKGDVEIKSATVAYRRKPAAK